MPAPDDRVEWSLWTSSNDTSSLNLKMDFYDMMKALGKHQYFTPYYQVQPSHTTTQPAAHLTKVAVTDLLMWCCVS